MSAADYPPGVQLYAVEAQEINPPAGQKPIHWRLLTTHAVMTLEQALQMIEWYRWRWKIELLFATLKTAGLDIEFSELDVRWRNSTTHRLSPIGGRPNFTVVRGP